MRGCLPGALLLPFCSHNIDSPIDVVTFFFLENGSFLLLKYRGRAVFVGLRFFVGV